MAHTITPQVLERGPKFTVVKYNIKGDSKTATELVNAVLFDASAYGTKTDNKLFDIMYDLGGFTADLFWDATANVPLLTLAKDREEETCFIKMGGLRNNGGTGRTGDILITTTGLASTILSGHIILRVAWR